MGTTSREYNGPNRMMLGLGAVHAAAAAALIFLPGTETVSPQDAFDYPRYVQTCRTQNTAASLPSANLHLDSAWMKACVAREHVEQTASNIELYRGTGIMFGFGGLAFVAGAFNNGNTNTSRRPGTPPSMEV